MTELPDMRMRYEQALAEIAEMKRALAERARHVAELEDRLMRQVEEGARGSAGGGRRARRPAAPEPTESDLAQAVAAAEAEKALATAERDKLDERERNIRKVERELAGLRVQLEKEWQRIKDATGSEPQPSEPRPAEPKPGTKPPAPTPLPQQPSETELPPAATARRRTTRRR